MSGLIKGGSTSPDTVARMHWRALGESAAGEAADPRLAELEATIESLTLALQKADVQHAQALAAARKEAREEAAEAYRRDEAKALAALGTGIAAALTSAREELTALENLAPVLCETALEATFGQRDDYRERTSRAIERQLVALRQGMVLAVAVSTADFPDPEALENLGARLGALKIEGDPTLAQGEARIELRLGSIELSLVRHWDALRTELRSMVEGRPSP